METKVIEWNQSNIEVQITISPEEYKKNEEKALKELSKDMKVPWFRPWHIPLEIVKEKIDPKYLKSAVYEVIINNTINNLLKEWKYRLIWNIYDIQTEEKENLTKLTFKVDFYPEVKVKNNNYEFVEVELPDFQVSEEEVNKAINNLKAHFADYKDVEKINVNNSFVKLQLDYLDENGNKIWEEKVLLWKADFEEFPMLKEMLEGKEKGFCAELDYDTKLPRLLQYFGKDKDKLNIKKVRITVVEIKEQVLPELTLENIEKWFWKKYTATEDFIKEIKQTLELEKKKVELAKFVENLVEKIKDSFEVVIPKTLIDQEVKQRLESLKQRYGWEKKFEEVLRNMKPEEVKRLYEDITNAAKESLKKFLILMKYAELKKILDKVDFKKDLDFEEKLLSLFKKDK